MNTLDVVNGTYTNKFISCPTCNSRVEIREEQRDGYGGWIVNDAHCDNCGNSCYNDAWRYND